MFADIRDQFQKPRIFICSLSYSYQINSDLKINCQQLASDYWKSRISIMMRPFVWQCHGQQLRLKTGGLYLGNEICDEIVMKYRDENC